LDEETWGELRRKNLLYSCKESWELGHWCMGKGKVHYIEVGYDEEDDDDDDGIGKNSSEPSHIEATEQVPLQNKSNGVTISTLLGVPKYYTFRFRGL